MRSARLASIVVLLLVVAGFPAYSVAAQDAASPVAMAGPNDLNLPGIDSQLLGSGMSSAPLSGMPRMLLERIDLPSGASLPMHTAGGPELLVAEEGAPGITDSFGFTGQIAPGGTFFEIGAQYLLSNPGTETASALRLSVTEGIEASQASPVAGDADITVLIDSPLADPRISEPAFTIAKLTWQPGAEIQSLDHTAPIGLIVLEGTLFAKSPSGFDGQLAPNTPVVFPASTPLEARAGDDGPASALIVSVTSGSAPIVSAPEPTPTPTLTATATLESTATSAPTETSIPTETLIPTQTPVPTETPIPTATSTPLPSFTPTESPTPAPTVDPNTAAGSVLDHRATWRSGDASLKVDVEALKRIRDFSDCRGDEPGALVTLTYTNIGKARADFLVIPEFISVSSDDGDTWRWRCWEMSSDQVRVLLDPGESLTFNVVFESPGGTSSVTTAAVLVSEMGEVRDARWSFDWVQGRVETASLNPGFAGGALSVSSDTGPSAILGNNETWRQGEGLLWTGIRSLERMRDLDVDDCNKGNNRNEPGVYVLLRYVNIGGSRADFIVDPNSVGLIGNNGTQWELTCFATDNDQNRHLIDPGAVSWYQLGFKAPFGVNDVDTVTIRVPSYGSVQNALWQFDWIQGKVESTAESLTQGGASASASSLGQGVASPATTLQALPITAVLPAALETLVLQEQGVRSQAEVTRSFPNATEAEELFTKWGWSSSNYEIFSAPTGTTGEDGVYEVDIGIHQLGGPKQAEEAMQYFMMARANLLGLWPAEVESLGSMSLALTGPSGDGGYEASVYAAVGSQVVRVTALSWNDYPLGYATGILRQTIGG